MSNGNQPLVSIVIATHNYGQYIEQAVESVIKQTFTDWELVIIDDGSTDNTKENLSSLLKDKRITYFWQENLGQPKAKNRGIQLAKGEFIAFLDADDAWLPEKLEKQLPVFDKDLEIGITYTGLQIMNENGQLGEIRQCKKLKGNVFKESLYQTIPPFSSTIVRKTVLKEVGLFNEHIPLAIDFELWLRVSMRYQFNYIDEPLLFYRTGHANLSKRYKERRKIVINYILPHVLNDCGGRKLLTSKETSEAYARLFAGMGADELIFSSRSSIFYYSKAIVSAPWLISGWRGLLRACMPNPIVHFIKKGIVLWR